jgi:flagellar biosynthesis component FlhA
MLKELLVPFGLLVVLGSMLLPVPPGVLDFLLVGNLVLALILFVSALYVSDSLKLSSLPSLLLIATIYRLGLNVATTRAILGAGDAGDVVHAFGDVVIGGNLVVGVVVFLILTLIQFIVIAKGAERVAEVAARFTLDALPGKQMSIDADVRAGLIDFETARRRRNEMQTESRFYGALDGAMKFVKGDAIAGICMVAVNIVGGLLVGITMEGLDPGRAVQKYTLLTIGDGLVSQIPALLNALSAGMVVTRVSRGDGATLAQELLSQLGQVRKARIMIGVLALLLSLVPGMPMLPFFTLSMVLFLGALGKAAPEAPVQSTETLKFEPRSTPVLLIELGSKASQQLHGSRELLGRVQEFRKQMHAKSGLVLGVPEIASVREGEGFAIKLRGVPMKQGEVGGDAASTLNLIFSALSDLVQERAADLIDDIMTRRALDFFEREAPELVTAVIPTLVTVTQLTEVLRQLVREDLPICNFDMIVQALAEHGGKASGERALLEEVRIALRRLISHRHAKEGRVIDAVVLDAPIDVALVRTEREGQPLDLDLMFAIERALGEVKNSAAVLVVSKGARRLLMECLRLRGNRMPVIAHEEVAEEYSLRVLQRIEISDRELQTSLMEKLAA